MADRSRAHAKGSLHTRPLSPEEGQIIDYLGVVGFHRADGFGLARSMFSALGTVAARGMVDIKDGEARLSDRGQIAARQRRQGTGWSDARDRARLPAQRRSTASARYLLNGELLEGGLAAFFRDNDFEEDELADMRRLQPGQTYRSGGGGWAGWDLKRIA